ncbi:MAG: BTAD domain-containing putative transcriptional regulator [Gemmatimonadales bacterium]
MFWPELDEQRARASLRQALYNIRHALGGGALRVRGKTLLGVNPAKLTCDAAEFGRFLEEGRDEEALALYTGPFMEGFHLPGVPEFEHWLDNQRLDFRLRAVAAAWRLVDAAQAALDPDSSRRWAERAIELAPYDEAGFRRYMELLGAQGNRALALLVYDRLGESLRADLGVDASRETDELAQRLRRHATAESAGLATQHRVALPYSDTASRRTPPTTATTLQKERTEGPPFTKRVATRRHVLALAAVTMLALLAHGYHTARPSGSGNTRAQIRSLVVLPLSTAADDEQQRYFADEMTDALIAELGQVTALRVTSLTTARHLRGPTITIATIAERLNVDGVIEGSVALHDGRVRVNVRLIGAATDHQLWSHTYEEDVTDVLSLQKEIARSVADELRVGLTAQQSARLSATRQVNPDAYAAYLRGRYQFSRWTSDGWATAAQAFREAVTLDSGYAGAWAGLSTSISHLCYFGMSGGPPPEECQEAADEAILNAVTLDPDLSEAQVILGFRRWWGQHRDLTGAQTALRRAIQLNPSNAEAYNRYAFLLATIGRYDESLRNFERAVALDPLAPERATFLVWGYGVARRYEEGEEIARRAIALDPTFPNGYAWLGFCVLAPLRRYDEAIANLQRARELVGQNAAFEAMLGYVHGKAEHSSEAEKILARLTEGAAAGRVSPYYVSFVQVGLGRYEEAISSLERAYDDGWGHVIYINAYAAFDPLRAYPRFQRLVRHVGLPKFQLPVSTVGDAASR